MSLESFKAVAAAYEGCTEHGSNIILPKDIKLQRIIAGMTISRISYADVEYSELVGIWREFSDDATYHTVLSDTRPQSGLSVIRIPASTAENPAGGLHMEMVYSGMDIVVTPEGAASIGGMCVAPFVESELCFHKA
jgi:hypothetical protein